MPSEEKDTGKPTAPEPESMPDGDEPPPRGVKTMAVVRWALLAIAAVVMLGSWWSYACANRHTGASTAVAPKYHCPMHPQIVSDQPGECPICHMALEPIPEQPVAATDAAAPMAVPIPADGGVPLPGATPPGTVPIQLALDRVQAIGVRTAIAREGDVSDRLRVTAVVAPTDQGVAQVHVRAPGFIERIDVNQEGVSVARGQTLLGVYSPEIFQAESELLVARQWGDAGTRTLSAARQKLELLGMASKDIDEVLAKGEALRAIPIYAPQGGYIAKKNAVAGAYVTPEMTLYEIQDLSRVYVIADVFQRDLAMLRPGIEGRFTPNGRPEASVQAKIDLIYPTVNVEARTTRVRMQVRNEGNKLLQGAYGTVEFALAGHAGGHKIVMIPRDAVIDTGTSVYVFVVEGDGRYAPRTVRVGAATGDEVAVEDGLAPGERVVSGASFLIDAESRLQASFAQTAPAPPPSASPTKDTGAGPSCDAAFDRSKYPDKYTECRKCAQVHHGMGSMEADCKNAIPKPWNSGR